MTSIRRSADASNDLITIWAYVARDNPSAADKLIDEIDRNLARLLMFPLLGEAVDYLSPGVRRVIVGNYQLFYEPSTNGGHLLRVYHSSRSIEDLFSS